MSINRGNPDRQPRRKPAYRRGDDRPIQPFPTQEALVPAPAVKVKSSLPAANPYSAPLTEPRVEPVPQPVKPGRSRKRGSRRLFRAIRRLISRFKGWLLWLLTTWQFLITASFLTCLGAAVLAIAFIFQLPALPNCPAVFWPLASASMRFECARIAASKQTAKDLLEAIALVDGLAPDHAMRPEADRMIELWSQEVLKLADELFHKGDLKEAVAAAEKIPAQVTASRLVQERVKRWQTTWAKAEGIYQRAEAALRKRDWRTAFQLAVGLLDIDNKYWQTVRYDDLNNRINTSRVDGNKLFEAEWLAEAGDQASLLKAIKLAEEIRPESYIYALAQVKIQAFGRSLLDLAQKAIDRRNLQDALSIISQIPKRAQVESEKRDLTVLANAQAQVWQNTVSGLEEAISQAQRILPGRPFYKKSQQLIGRWQFEIEGLAQIERARLLAQTGTVEALLSAIAAASQVSSTNPRWNEAQTQIKKWQSETQTIEDRPLLAQADQFASGENINSLQAAVAQASQIAPGRSLYQEAQSKIRQWTGQIQQLQDQPYLTQARSLAFAGNLRDAIRVAEQIRPSRSLYNEAQADITKWRSEIQAEVAQAQAAQAQAQAQRTLQEARQLASVGSATALTNAIRVASQISGNSLQSEVNVAINEWSWQLLQLARDQALALNFPAAVAIAQKIPSRAAAYSEAQTQIQAWQQPIR